MWKSASLAVKLIISIILGAGFIFALVLGYNYHASKEALLQEMKENARNLTWKTVYQIDAILNSMEKVPEGVAVFLASGGARPVPPELLLREMLQGNEEIFGMAAAFEPNSFDKQK
jgi:phosphoserine phosphatase RsbU/P